MTEEPVDARVKIHRYIVSCTDNIFTEMTTLRVQRWALTAHLTSSSRSHMIRDCPHYQAVTGLCCKRDV